jgi:hypothetical protein
VVSKDERVEGRIARGVRGHGKLAEYKSRLEKLIEEALLWFTAWDT